MPNPMRTHEPKRLTKRSVDAARPNDREYVLWDSDIRGFGLKVMPNGRKIFLLKYRPDRSHYHKPTLGVYGSITPDLARNKAKDILADVAKGKCPGCEKKIERVSLTFAELAQRYIDEYARPRKRSWQEDQRILLGAKGRGGRGKDVKYKKGYFPSWQSKRADTVTPTEIATRLFAIKKNNGPVMANRARASVSGMYAWAKGNVQIPLIEENPVRDISPPSDENDRERVYTEKEIRNLWEAFGKVGVIGPIYKNVLVTGQRRSEVAGTPWQEIDGGLWTIPSARTKNKRVHAVPLSEFALELFEVQQGRHKTWAYPSPTRPDQPISSMSRAAAEVKKLSGVTDFRSHDLRRTMATECTKMGFSRFLVDRLLNHTDQGVGGVYDRHDYLKEKAEIADAWGRRLRNILEGGKVIQMAKPATPT